MPRHRRLRPVAIDEIGLGAMQLGIDDTDTHWLGFLGNLSVHEAGFLTSEDGTIDHLAIADQPLEDVRAQFGVPPREC